MITLTSEEQALVRFKVDSRVTEKDLPAAILNQLAAEAEADLKTAAFDELCEPPRGEPNLVSIRGDEPDDGVGGCFGSPASPTTRGTRERAVGIGAARGTRAEFSQSL